MVSYDSFPVDSFVAASCLIALPVPSTGPFPCEDAKKFHVISILHSFCNQDKVAAMYWFLNWLLGPLDHMCNPVMFSLSSCLMICPRNTTTQSLEWLWSFDATTAKVQPTLCQKAKVKAVIWFLCQWADWTSTCQKGE